MSAESIAEVIQKMEAIMERSMEEKDAIGYFSGMYRLVTITVRDAAAAGEFDENERMLRLVVRFANRYLEAYEQYVKGEAPSSSWFLAFDAARHTRILVLQHLMLGMNAHINLDLGLAAATLCPGEEIKQLENDFLNINIILANLVNEVQQRISRVSPLMALIDRLGRSLDEQMAGFSLVKARDAAWEIALQAAPLEGDEWKVLEKLADKKAARLAQRIIVPSRGLRFLTWLASWLENQNKAKIVRSIWGEGAPHNR
jgi:hypothetical protein